MLSIFNLSGGTAQSSRSHCSIQAEPLLNFAGQGDFTERCTQRFQLVFYGNCSTFAKYYSLSLPAQLSAAEISVDHSPCILPNMPQTGAIAAQNQGFLFRRTPLPTYLPTDSEKLPRRGFPSGGVNCFLSCCPSAPSLSCLEVGHSALLSCVFFCRQRLRFGDARVDPRRLPPHLLRDAGVYFIGSPVPCFDCIKFGREMQEGVSYGAGFAKCG